MNIQKTLKKRNNLKDLELSISELDSNHNSLLAYGSIYTQMEQNLRVQKVTHTFMAN